MKRGFIGLLILTVSASTWYWMEWRSYGPPQHPLYSMKVSIYDGAEGKFHETMRNFAADRGFRIQIEPITPDEKNFSITLRRQDIWMNLISDSRSAWDYYGAFYRTYKPAPSMELILELAESLKLQAEMEGAFFEFYDPEIDNNIDQ